MPIVSYRYSNDKIYVQPLVDRLEDKENIIAARVDWRADGVVPIREFDAVFPDWIMQVDSLWKQLGMTENTEAEALRVGTSVETNSVLPRSFYPEPFYLTDMIYEKSSDEFIGFARSWINGTTSEHIVTCFHPDQREKGYHNDFSVAAGKSWFTYADGGLLLMYTPKSQTSYYIEDPDIEVARSSLDRIDSVDYIETRITKADYTAWMDLPDNQADRDATFTIERYIEA